MNEMYDLIYAEDMEAEAKTDILSVFPDATFMDANDGIHKGRFGVTLECETDNWCMQMFLLGMYDLSLHMGLWRLHHPDEYIAMMHQAVETKKQAEATNG